LLRNFVWLAPQEELGKGKNFDSRKEDCST
jgi:hypothetical protein